MKKLLAVLFVAAAFVMGAFAEDAVTFPSGAWVDELYNGEWVISADTSVKLNDSKTGELIYNFTNDKIENKQVFADKDGIYLTFSCKETHRAYKFFKELTLDKDIKIVVDPDWTTEDYGQLLHFKEIK